MRKLLVLPGNCDTIGGTLVSLSMLIAGFKKQQIHEQLCVLVRTDSPMEKYLQHLGQDFCVQKISADNDIVFFQLAVQWISKQPKDYPLLLDNCVYNYLLPTLLRLAPLLRFSGRTIYHFCHDIAASNKLRGYLARKSTFFLLSPGAICNSNFTAQNVRHLMPNIQGILYQPINKERFNDSPLYTPPKALQPIIESGFRIMLTPSRLNSHAKDCENGDKNLRTLIPVLAHLKAKGYNYFGVIVGEDKSPNQDNSRILVQKAEEFGVADRFLILPPTIAIEDYYKCADIMVTLAYREAFCRIVVEAIACGVPVVGANSGGIGEILSNFAPEWMVEPDDPIAAAEAVIRIENEPNRKLILTQGQRWVDKHCCIESYAISMAKITKIHSTNIGKDPVLSVS